jgi:nitrate/TMAO reductase-like tetraheme cytochrome c subunit
MRSGASKLPFLIGLAFLLVGTLFLASTTNGVAAPRFQDELATPTAEPAGSPAIEGNIIGNNVCLSCHGQPGLTKTLVHGDILDLYVSPEQYAASVHGSQGYACVQCHINYSEIPHPIRNFADLRDVTLQLSSEACDRCHTGEAQSVQDSVHATAQAAGLREAAVCSDCHSPHATQQINDPVTGQITSEARLQIPKTCSQCHYAIYVIYSTSVHGGALFDQNNMDVPTCIDCHGVHNITDPTTTAFRLASPELCASCHTDPELMDKYGISTAVLNTYIADFHGTTVTLFEKQTPDAETNKPVCYDCHGVHNIASASDPEKGLRVRENLLARCQLCHPDATENFPDSWLSHYIPNPEKTPVVYYVNLFYKFFIPGVLGGMGILVALDAGKSLTKTYKKYLPQRQKQIKAASEGEPPTVDVETAEEPLTMSEATQKGVTIAPKPEEKAVNMPAEPEILPELPIEPDVPIETDDQETPQTPEPPGKAENDKPEVAHE